MTRPKSWGEANQLKLVHHTIEWDEEATSAEVLVPLASRPVNIAVDNQSNQALGLTFAHLLRVDHAQAIATIAADGSEKLTLAYKDPGPAGNEYSVEIVVPDEAAELTVTLDGKLITISLATKEDSEDEGTIIPDDTANTLAAVYASLTDALDDLFTVTYEGDDPPEDVFKAAVPPVLFTGDATPVYAPLYDADGDELEITVPAKTTRVYGPFAYFPRFLGGKLTLTTDTTPEGATTVQVVEG